MEIISIDRIRRRVLSSYLPSDSIFQQIGALILLSSTLSFVIKKLFVDFENVKCVRVMSKATAAAIFLWRQKDEFNSNMIDWCAVRPMLHIIIPRIYIFMSVLYLFWINLIDWWYIWYITSFSHRENMQEQHILMMCYFEWHECGSKYGLCSWHIIIDLMTIVRDS